MVCSGHLPLPSEEAQYEAIAFVCVAGVFERVLICGDPLSRKVEDPPNLVGSI